MERFLKEVENPTFFNFFGIIVRSGRFVGKLTGRIESTEDAII
ncbi:hypothetical protein [Dyadobacter sp. LHD-138]|nr:hypothetical protein [Dyadobacter sp. LHD-138]MDQ6476930.1 hypothetical protein [Dyadobacter sp. LHD-138]